MRCMIHIHQCSCGDEELCSYSSTQRVHGSSCIWEDQQRAHRLSVRNEGRMGTSVILTEQRQKLMKHCEKEVLVRLVEVLTCAKVSLKDNEKRDSLIAFLSQGIMQELDGGGCMAPVSQEQRAKGRP